MLIAKPTIAHGVLAALLACSTFISSGITYAADTLQDTLLSAGDKNQVIQFNPNAALQKRIFADTFVPNSLEFSTVISGTSYTAQRAENLASGQVRVYYVTTGDWGNMHSIERGQGANDSLGNMLLTEGEKHLAMRFNPDAALQKHIFADGFVPNSPEFSIQVEGVSYLAQRAENLHTGQVQVYHAVIGDWGKVAKATKVNTGLPAPQPTGTTMPNPVQSPSTVSAPPTSTCPGWFQQPEPSKGVLVIENHMGGITTIDESNGASQSWHIPAKVGDEPGRLVLQLPPGAHDYADRTIQGSGFRGHIHVDIKAGEMLVSPLWFNGRYDEYVYPLAIPAGC